MLIPTVDMSDSPTSPVGRTQDILPCHRCLLVTGPMCGQKTAQALLVSQKWRVFPTDPEGKDILIVVPKKDTRYGSEDIVSRAKMTWRTDASVERMMDVTGLDGYDEASIIMLDEIHMFEPGDVSTALAQMVYTDNKSVIVCGLNRDMLTTRFPATEAASLFATDTKMCVAKCIMPGCTNVATLTAAKILESGKWVSATSDVPESRIVVGGSGSSLSYHPVCAAHHPVTRQHINTEPLPIDPK